MFARDIRKHYGNADAIKQEKTAYPDVKFRYLFTQVNDSLSGKKELTFNNETTWPLQEDGRNVAQQTLNAGQGAFFNHLDEFIESKSLKIEHKT